MKHAQDHIISFWKKPEKRRIRSEQSSFNSANKKPVGDGSLKIRGDGRNCAANIAIEQEIKALKENALKKEAEAVELVIPIGLNEDQRGNNRGDIEKKKEG